LETSNHVDNSSVKKIQIDYSTPSFRNHGWKSTASSALGLQQKIASRILKNLTKPEEILVVERLI
jgi:hypothetical protein